MEVQTWRGISSTDKHLDQNHIILAVKFLSCAVKFLSHAVKFLSHAINLLSHAVNFLSHAVKFLSHAVKVPILCKFLLRRIRSKDMEVLMPHNLENFETACFFRKEILNNWQEQTAWNNSPDRTGNPFLPDFRLVKKIVGKSGTGLWKENGCWSSLQKSHFSWWNGFLLLISFWT